MFARFKGCNIVHINCKCVKEALLHRMCRADVHCGAPAHHHSIPSVHYQAQYNVMSDYIRKLCVVEVTEVFGLKFFRIRLQS